jgi:hypothetical protein
MTHPHSLLSQALNLVADWDAAPEERRQRVFEFEKAVLEGCESAASVESTGLSPLLVKLNRIYESFETDLEVEFAGAFLAADVEVERYPLYQRFAALISNEVRLAGLKPGDSVTVIGSGPFPISAILLSRSFGMNVIAIDRDPSAAKLSRDVLRKLGLEKAVRVELAEGQRLAMNGSSAAIIALLAQPKAAILQNVFEHECCESVICRTSHGLRQALYCPTDSAALAPYQIVATNVAAGDQTISSILLRRRPTSAS